MADWDKLMTDWSAMEKGRNDWYLAPSLIALGNEINARWPSRDTASDGAIGDASHQARTSDHNPDWSAGGVVRAIDVDNDGIDVQELLDATIGDQRVWYVIWDRHIYSRTYNWQKSPYTGADPHTGHLHISINHTQAAETDTSKWFVVKPTPPKDTEDPLMALTDADAAKIGAATAAALAPIIAQQTTAEYAGDQKLVVADNNFDSQRAAYEAVAQAEAAHVLGGGTPHTADELKTAQGVIWSYLRPLWGAK
jgi:hypothetical protein